MPEVRFQVRWPDGTTADCYSPSRVIEEHLQQGASYSLAEFVERSRMALNLASERVRAKYGFACSSAMDQLSEIEIRAEALRVQYPSGQVTVLRFAKGTYEASKDA